MGNFDSKAEHLRLGKMIRGILNDNLPVVYLVERHTIEAHRLTCTL